MPGTSLRSLSPLFSVSEESIIHSDPEFSLKDNYFMTQNERYEAAVKRKFHLQTIAKRQGWSEGSPELYYSYRYSLPGQPPRGEFTWDHLESPNPMRGIFPNFKGSGHWEASMTDAPSLLHPARLAVPGSLSRWATQPPGLSPTEPFLETWPSVYTWCS